MSHAQQTLPLAEALMPQLHAAPSSGARLALQVLAGVAFLAALAQIRIPIGPIPFTGQTLGVLLIGAAYGYRRGTLTVMAYLLAGACGLPLFQAAAGGLLHFTGPTGGYLLGFPLAAALVGFLAQRGWTRTPWMTVLAMLAGDALIFATGLLWLNTFMPGIGATLAAGLFPFIVGDLIKIALAAALLPAAWRLIDARY